MLRTKAEGLSEVAELSFLYNDDLEIFIAAAKASRSKSELPICCCTHSIHEDTKCSSSELRLISFRLAKNLEFNSFATFCLFDSKLSIRAISTDVLKGFVI